MCQNVKVRVGCQTELPLGRYIVDVHHRSCPILIDTNRYSSTSSDDSNIGGTRPGILPSAETPPIRKNTRQRHRFNKGNNSISIDDIPSFHDFQRSMQIRTLYRQYTRLIGLYSRKNKNATKITDDMSVATASALTHQQQLELQNQVRTAFKHHQNTNHKTDVFYIQKSLAEGQRRYKELFTMIHGTATTVLPETTTAVPTRTPVSDWPWNKVETKGQEIPSDQPFPFKFPPKSNV